MIIGLSLYSGNGSSIIANFFSKSIDIKPLDPQMLDYRPSLTCSILETIMKRADHMSSSYLLILRLSI